MTFLKSFFDKKFFWENLKQQKYLMILHTILLFICTTLPALVVYNDAISFNEPLQKYSAQDLASLLSGYNPFLMVLLTVMAIVTSIFCYNYLYKHQSVQFYHSTPYKRECIYTTKFISGVVGLLLPVVLIYIVNSILFMCYGLDVFEPFSVMITSFSIVVLSYVCVFAVASFGASVSGNFFAQLIITAFVFLVYLVSTAVVMLSYEVWFNNLSIVFNYNESFIFPPAVLAYGELSFVECIFAICYTLAFFIIGLLLFKYRKSESTGKFFAYNSITVFLKYYVAFIASLCFGALFIAIGRGNMFISYFGYILSAFVVFIGLQGIFNKSFKAMFSNMKSFIIFAILICLVVTVPVTMKEYFENTLPDIDDVDAVTTRIYSGGYYNNYTFSEKENIANTLKMFSYNDLQPTVQKFSFNNTISGNLTINPGAKLFNITYRRNLITEEVYTEWFSKIYDTKEYKDYLAKAFNVDYASFPYVEIRKTGGYVLGKEDIILYNKLKDAYLKDLSENSYEDVSESYTFAIIHLSDTDVRIYDCYENTMEVIKTSEIGERIYYNTDNVEKIVISSYDYDKQIHNVYYETTHPEAIKNIIDRAVDYGRSVEMRIVKKDGSEDSYLVNFSNLPSYVKNAILNN